ncbi:dihydrodipicolinate synthase family protein [Paracoccus aerodenitrificans]|uniref:dihydrodipicolinate synthase family protein n=1 Tax=Paracoccus aerodenitrificans TaxID=3017781 RepID=UPI0022F0AE8D|nr:dihydrodipicolinate synthase family protein [Paracoccus aerodenitrificans]WBU65300.1 dihydrodipicolinate synthase family protein [Paracoccus aerodenitrificans]
MKLPLPDGTLQEFRFSKEPLTPRAPGRAFSRTAFAAAHIASDPLAERDPWTGPPAVDWEATLAFRRSLWDQGLGLAEAMDTAQRGMGVDWETALELIRRTMAEAKAHPLKPRVACGAGTDHKTPEELPDTASIIAAYEHQMACIEDAGGQLILMATRALPAIGAGPDEYRQVYDRLIGQARDPVILHWLGDMFDPALRGYWACQDIAAASDAVLALIEAHAGKVDGIKISLLDQQHEESFRARLPEGVKLYTGDDFNYAALIAGDGQHHSHALLGAFAAIAPAAAQALEALAAGDRAGYDALMTPTIPLSREIFRAPTRFYKAGIAFLAWLNGMQTHFIMPAGFQSSRPILHYADLFRLAADAGLLHDADLASARMRNLMAVHGIGE